MIGESVRTYVVGIAIASSLGVAGGALGAYIDVGSTKTAVADAQNTARTASTLAVENNRQFSEVRESMNGLTTRVVATEFAVGKVQTTLERILQEIGQLQGSFENQQRRETRSMSSSARPGQIGG